MTQDWQLRTILVPLDGTALAELALPVAARLARASGAQMWLVSAASGSLTAHMAKEYLGGISADLAQDGLSVQANVVSGEPAAALFDEARRLGADLIVMGTHARSGTARWVAGSVAETLLERAGVPLLLLRDQAPTTDRLLGSRPHLLVPLDGSTFAEAALPVATELARCLDGVLSLLYVVNLWDDLLASNRPMGRQVQPLSAARQSAQAYLESVAGRCVEQGASPPRTLVAEGSPVETIRATALAERTALVVMATHGRSELERGMPDAHAAAVVRQVATPLLLVRPSVPAPLR